MSATARYRYPLNLPLSLKETAARLAKDDGVSLNQWIATAVAQKIGAVETAEVFPGGTSRSGEPQGSPALSRWRPGHTAGTRRRNAGSVAARHRSAGEGRAAQGCAPTIRRDARPSRAWRKGRLPHYLPWLSDWSF